MTRARSPAPLALWATPRTVSTAFDKMMRTRGDHRVLTEPFSIAYYFGPERRSEHFEVDRPEATFAHVRAEVLAAAAAEPVFIKEMPYQLGPELGIDLLDRFRGTFLVRDPAHAIPSLARQGLDFTDEETGYPAQVRAFRLLRDAGRNPPVIDSDELRADPDGMVRAWCASVGIPHLPGALRWEPGMPEDWRVWESWMTAAAASTGFAPPSDEPPPPVSGRLAEVIAWCRPLYEELHAHRLAP